VGTLDGANIEMLEAVGQDNFFLFGMTAKEVGELAQAGYHPYQLMNSDARLREVFEFIRTDKLCPLTPGLFDPIMRSLLYEGDRYFLIADLPDYMRVMQELDQSYRDPLNWARKSVANITGMAGFSSDETIKKYATDIWGIKLK